MTARVLLDRMHRGRWLKLRRDGLTATDVPAVLGCSKWRTPLDVWMDKRRLGVPVDVSYAMARGLALEPTLAAEYARRYPTAFVEVPPALVAHPDWPVLRCSLDRVAHHPDRTVVVEIKTAGWHDRAEWWDDGLPDMYAVQVLTQLAVTGLDEAHVFADVAGDVREVVIRRDVEWEADTLPWLRDWWQTHVIDGVVPPVLPADYPLLNRLWAPVPGVSVVADEDTCAAVGTALVASAAASEHDRTAKAARTTVRRFMEHATALTDPVDGRRLASLDRTGKLRIDRPKAETGGDDGGF